jgi:hypothetical protein
MDVTNAPSRADVSLPAGAPLLTWSQEEFRHFGRRFQKTRHRLGDTGLFTDSALVRLIDEYPRHLLQAFVMGSDPARMDENLPVDTTGVTGAAAIEAVKRGRLWFKLLRIQDWRGPYATVVRQLYDELARQSPGFMPLTLGAVLFFGSTASQVYFHVDSKPNMLWHIRGRKRFWLYPALDTDLVTQEALEDVYTMVTDEDVPFRAEFDRRATLFELEPGDALSWPHNSPHRVEVTEGMSVSLGTLHETATSIRRSHVVCANALLRKKLGLQSLSMNEHGFGALAKSFGVRAARRLGIGAAAPHKPYRTSYLVDPDERLGVRELPEVVFTEFARGPQRKDPSTGAPSE